MSKSHLTRREMYDLVWSQPLETVAENFGLPEASLRKICDHHRVPIPPPRYWTQKTDGKDVKQTRLYPTDNPQDEWVHLALSCARPPATPPRANASERGQRLIRSRLSVETMIEPVEPLHDIHPTVMETARTLRGATPDADGAVRATGSGECGVVIGTANIERSIRVVDGLARALESRGLALHGAGRSMQITSGEDQVTFSLTERTEVDPHVPTLRELAGVERRRTDGTLNPLADLWRAGYGRAEPAPVIRFTGCLMIRLADQHVRGTRRIWRDGKTRRLENITGDIADGIVAYLDGIRARREELERFKREWRLSETLRALAQAREEREKRRRDFVSRYTAILAEITELETFFELVQRRNSANGRGELARIVIWVNARLTTLRRQTEPDRIAAALTAEDLFPETDDLTSSPPDILVIPDDGASRS